MKWHQSLSTTKSLPNLINSNNWKVIFLPFLESSGTAFVFENSYNMAAESLKNEEHKSITRHFQDHFLKSFSQCFDENASRTIKVFCHGIFYQINLIIKLFLKKYYFVLSGDCWNNNLMFRFNENVNNYWFWRKRNNFNSKFYL